jgi:iron complex outermembrane receptor protein
LWVSICAEQLHEKTEGTLGRSPGDTLSPRGSKARWTQTGRPLSVLVFTMLLIVPAWPQQKPADLTDRSIEDLMNIEVTSVSKKEQKLAQTAAAIFVITAEDIRRSGATNIPDLLRMVSGLDVAQINASSWAISSRGFNEQVSNTFLVLIDGRSVYSVLFSGVFWDVQEVPLEEIERIEIIRGPGAAVWGANAVNGVINIIRKKTSDTQGLLVTGGGGTTEGAFSTVRFGGKFGSDTTYRVDSDGFKRNSLKSATVKTATTVGTFLAWGSGSITSRTQKTR